MPFPDLTIDEVAQAVPEATGLRYIGRGGQKIVFAGAIDGQLCAIKFLRPNPSPLSAGNVSDASVPPLDDVTARAEREVRTMRQCRSPYLVRVGPIDIKTVKVSGEDLLCFAEEFIEGEDLRMRLQTRGRMAISDIVRLCIHITMAIEALWKRRKIHRDVKPSNIMRRAANGDFVLLDMGLVFDLDDTSWSVAPVGTLIYFSPEQMDFANRRAILDFRSDLFSLGVVAYEMATGMHPFVTPDIKDSWGVLNNIRNLAPLAPRDIRSDIPEDLCEVILRLLGKRPALRYRQTSKLLDALGAIA